MSGWMAAAQIGGDLLGAYLGYRGQRDANETNYRIAKEQMEFQERMSNTSWQRSVADMRAAGINPLMSVYKGGASTPAGASAHMENEMAIPASSAQGMARRVGEIMALQAQINKVRADTRLVDAEATIRENQVPHSAAMAKTTLDKLQEEVVQLGQMIEKSDIDISHARLNLAQAEKMLPLLIDAQELVNRGLKAGMSRKDLESSIAEMFSIPFDKAGAVIEYLNNLGGAMGRGAADAVEYVRGLPEFIQEWARARQRGK